MWPCAAGHRWMLLDPPDNAQVGWWVEILTNLHCATAMHAAMEMYPNDGNAAVTAYDCIVYILLLTKPNGSNIEHWDVIKEFGGFLTACTHVGVCDTRRVVCIFVDTYNYRNRSFMAVK